MFTWMIRAFVMAVALTLGCLPAAALAADEYYVWDVTLPSNAPPNSGSSVHLRSRPPRDNVSNILENAPNGNVGSSWAPLTCVVYNGWLKVDVALYANNWPSSFPSTATCVTTYNGVTYHLTTYINTETWDYDNGVVSNYPSGGMEFNLVYSDTVVGSLNQLPKVAGDYIQETTTAIKAGAPWSGVKCTILPNASGTWFLMTEIMDTAAEGTGYCRVRRPGMPPITTQVPVTHNRD